MSQPPKEKVGYPEKKNADPNPFAHVKRKTN
jgi:hypothetical protein